MTEKDKDFLEGLAISAACHVLPARKVFREPIAYSYNGVILPKLPEVDEEKCPCVYMYKSGSYYIIQFCGAFKPVTVSGSYTYINSAGNYVLYRYYPSTGEFEFRNEGYMENQTVSIRNPEDVFWANADLVYEDGSLFLATSEPIPVYE